MIKKRLTCVFAVLLSLILLLPGCSGGKSESSTNTTNAAASSSASTNPASTATEKVPDKITVFLSSGGQAVPDNFSYKDNDFFKEICKLANVEVEELTVPEYADTKTKFNLMMASGDIPDVVHYNNFAEMSQYGKDGAYLEMSDIIKNSALFSKIYTAPMIESMKAADGKVYTLRSLPTEDGWHIAARLDLLREVGYTDKVPSTLDEWVDALKKVKAKYPDSIPYTTTGVDNYHQFIFRPYGCESGWGWQYVGGKVQNTFENPNMKDAILFGKQLLADGLLDKEFATNKAADYQSKKITRNTLITCLNLGSVGNAIETYAKNKIDKAVFVPVDWPYVNEAGVDPYSKYVPAKLVANQCISINAKTTQKDAAVRFVETLFSDEVKDLVVYGREGIEYTSKDGKKVLDYTKQTETAWRNVYGMAFSYNPIEKSRVKCETGVSVTNISDADKAVYLDTLNKYFDDVYKTQYNQIGYAPVSTSSSSMNTMITLSSESNNLTKEAMAQQKSLMLKAIMGEITIDEFTKQAADLVKKYQSITDEFNQKLPEIKATYNIK